MELLNFEFSNKRIQPFKKWVCINVPIWLLNRKEISDGAKLLYGRLLMYVGKNEFCFPSQHRLAEDLNKSKRQINRYIHELKRCKLIEVKQQGKNKSSRYYVLEHIWQHSERGKYPRFNSYMLGQM